MLEKLPRSFYDRETIDVAKELLGKYLVHKHQGLEKVGRIVEVEAYLGEHDLASHSSKGKTPRTRIMFGSPGYAYIYLIYGIHHCFNVVTENEGKGAAVLIRALEPQQNITSNTKGPGLLCKAMGLERSLNGCDLLSNELFVAPGVNEVCTAEIIARPRVGVSYAKEWSDCLLRFYIKENQYVSKK